MKVLRFNLLSLLLVISLTNVSSQIISSLGPDTFMINGVSVPANFPGIDISVMNETAPGYLFLTNLEGPPYLMILKNDGTPYYYKRLPNPSAEFKVHPNGMLSHTLLNDSYLPDGFVRMDSNFKVLDTIQAAEGYDSDIHESLILPNGNSLIIAISTMTVDMSQRIPGGSTAAIVTGNHIQEFDSSKQLVFNWECWDHFDIEDAQHINLRANRLDYVHMNSIDIDYDGHILISSRHLSECTKINRQTGEIIWRLGGVNNQFNFPNDTVMISYQHDFRAVIGKPDHYTIFDNGNFHEPEFSRVVEYRVDTVDSTATKIWDYRFTPDKYSKSMSNAQRLDNGNTFMNWCQETLPKAIEVTPAGEIVYEANFSDEFRSYRSFRFEWNGKALAPCLIAEKYPDRIRLLFNQFGDTTVSYYNIYAGSNPDSLSLIDTTVNTWKDYTELYDSTYLYFKASSTHKDGSESMLSNLDSAFSNVIEPGGNLIYNGGFDLQKSHWGLRVGNPAIASDSIINGEYALNISNGGTRREHIELIQQNIPLIQGKRYVFEFDAYAENASLVYVDIKNSSGYFNDYSSIGKFSISMDKKHFTSYFTMADLTDLNAIFVLQSGTNSGVLYFDNFSVKEVLNPISATLEEKVDVSCSGKADGRIGITATGGAGIFSYTLLPDSITSTSGLFSPLDAGIYSVMIDDESILDPVYISDIMINEPDTLDIISTEVRPLSSDSANDGSISVIAGGGNIPYTFTLLPDTIINQTGEFNNLDSGTYKVIIDDHLGCGPLVTDSIYLTIPTSVVKISGSDMVSIYPNPGSDHINIKYDNNFYGDLSVSIFTQTGEMLKNFQINADHYYGYEFRIRTDDLGKGLYFIRIQLSPAGSTDQLITTEKLIIL